MSEIQTLLERQARWQKERAQLPWPEKIRMIERVRADFEKWIAAVRKGSPGNQDGSPAIPDSSKSNP